MNTLKSRIERLVEPRLIGRANELRLPRYFDPLDVEPLFIEWRNLRDELRTDPEFSVLPAHEIPTPSSTTDFDGRGYIERAHLERLLNDAIYAHDLLAHPSRDNESHIDSENSENYTGDPDPRATKEQQLKKHSPTDKTTPLGEAMQPDKREVFVVYGRDTVRKEFFFDFLRRVGLRPLEFETLIARSGVGTPYIGDIVRSAFEQATAVVVLFTGDDLAQLREEFARESDPPEEGTSTPQPRANVIFEAGMALALQRDRTVIVEVPPLRGLSDLHGLHVVRFTSGTASERNSLVTRLKISGCEVDISGNDWLKLNFPV
jgi:predicted nucleotide-binding protein